MLGIELVGGRWHRLMMARGTQLTYDDFAALPDDGKHYELGEVFFAPFDVILSEHDMAEPDILVVASASQFRNAASKARRRWLWKSSHHRVANTTASQKPHGIWPSASSITGLSIQK